MSGLSKKFQAAILTAVCAAGIVGCSKPPAAAKQAPAAEPPIATVITPATPRAEDPATTPNDPLLRGFYIVYGEVDKRSDLEYDRKLTATDGQPVSAVTISLPQGFPDAKSSEDYAALNIRNKALLDFMAACIGPENTKAITQMSEGIITVYTTPLTLRNTIEITHIAPGQKTYTTDAVLGCHNQPKADAAVMKLKADNALARR
jgi:hypothetical protein